jgi:hypothetical protein
MGQKETVTTNKNRIMIYGPKTERLLAGVLTVASGGWLTLILLGYLGSLGWATSLACSCCSASASPRCSPKEADMTTLRTHFTFRVDTWTPDGESIVEHVAGVEDYQVALATYRAACERWPGTPITLRQGARVIEDSRRLRTV